MLNEKIFKIAFFLVVVCVGLYFTYPVELTQAQKISYLRSYGITLILTSGGIAIGIVLGFILAFLRFLDIKPIRLIIDEYVDIIRGTPIVIQLMVFVFIIFATWSNNILSAIFALGLNSSAYVAEIVRSGINSVDRGQMEAARAMGLGYGT
ncbi:ABC transporter permease subunit, partial [uncultured Campylobacter sp.]|uniref:ABC transporter permease subunit n=1 Tax=uncultured Campylobacter sp. TaxID=218934 RepID=UPI00262847D0